VVCQFGGPRSSDADLLHGPVALVPADDALHVREHVAFGREDREVGRVGAQLFVLDSVISIRSMHSVEAHSQAQLP
jgi:hypothetical protein